MAEWFVQFAELIENVSSRLEEVSDSIGPESEDFENILMKSSSSLLKPRLRDSASEAEEFDMSTESGAFLLKQEQLFYDALEGR